MVNGSTVDSWCRIVAKRIAYTGHFQTYYDENWSCFHVLCRATTGCRLLKWSNCRHALNLLSAGSCYSFSRHRRELRGNSVGSNRHALHASQFRNRRPGALCSTPVLVVAAADTRQSRLTKDILSLEVAVSLMESINHQNTHRTGSTVVRQTKQKIPKERNLRRSKLAWWLFFCPVRSCVVRGYLKPKTIHVFSFCAVRMVRLITETKL